MIENILTWNQSTSIFLNTFTENSIMRIILPYFSDVPIFIIPIFLISYWIYAIIRWESKIKEALLMIFYADILAGSITILIQQFIYVERPLAFLQGRGMYILSHILDNSFPSDHATIGTAFLVGLFLFGYKKSFYYLLPLFILMFLARVIGGIHYPFDILWGIVVGVLSGYTIYMIRGTLLFGKINQVIIKLMRKIYL